MKLLKDFISGNYLLILLLMIIINSCEKDVVLSLSDQDKGFLIVEASITDDARQQWIRLTWSGSYYDLDVEPASGANVVISNGDKEFRFFESVYDSLNGYYINSGIGRELIANEIYTLQIEIEGKQYTAQSQYKRVPFLDSLTIQRSAFSDIGFSPDVLYDLFAHFEVSKKEFDYYLFNLYINRRLRTLRPSEKETLSNEGLQQYVSWPAIIINEKDVSPGDTLTLEIRSISRENFDFYNIFFFQTDLSGNPFAGAPPANIPTNISEGARGFFQVSAVNRKSIIFNPGSIP